MKLINYNIWMKKDNACAVGEFIKKQNADIVCLQEVMRHFEDSVFDIYKSEAQLKQAIGKIYPDIFFGPLWISRAIINQGKIHRNYNGLVEQGNEVLSKFPIVKASNEFYFKNYEWRIEWERNNNDDHGRAVQVVELNIAGKPLQILNLHGIYSQNKSEDERTHAQSQYIIRAAKRKKAPTIITGDFNMLPQSKSIGLLNREFRNLITEFGITSTISESHDDMNKPHEVIDYIFVNNMIRVNDCRTVATNISDHLPLALDFDIV